VIDDTPENIDIVKGVLSEEFVVKAVTSGERALNVVESVLPDVILLDVMMPGMDGYEVCERLKQKESTRSIPVIFVTALSEITDEERGFKVGCVDYLTKPINPSLTLARVRTHSALRQARLELEEWNSNLKSRVMKNVSTIREQIQKANELQSTYDGGSVNSIIIAVNGLLALHDPRHATHAIVVSRLASGAARSMALDNNAICKIKLAGLLHDIGKIGLPDFVLERPAGEMSENELEVYREHIVRSQYLVRENEELQDVLLMVKHHHEAFDGSGFPDGLKGEEIPLGARLVAIADAIDHAASTVNTDKADYVISELAVMAGNQLDATLMHHFHSAVRAVFPETG
jgi:putative two-component system response regulator